METGAYKRVVVFPNPPPGTPKFASTRISTSGACPKQDCDRTSTKIFAHKVLLIRLNLACFCVHFAFFLVTLFFVVEGDGKDRNLRAPLVRLRSVWTSRKIDGYRVDVVPSGREFDIGANTLLWFGITAASHLAGFFAAKYTTDLYWKCLEEARPLWCDR